MRTHPALQTVKYAILAVGMIAILIPMYITVVVAMKTPAESARSMFSLPSGFYLGNFEKVIHAGKYWNYVGNSVYITVVSIVLMLLLIPMVSFAISRNFKKKYYIFLFYFILSGIFVPFQVIMLPIVKHMSNLHLLNHTGLIIMYISLSFTQGMFLSVGFLKNIPMELDEASRIDGCGVWQTFATIIFPLMIPITSTILILNSLWIWNDFMLPLVLLNRSQKFWTLPLFIYNFKTEYTIDYNLAFAGFFMSMLPIIALYAFMQRYIISGLTEGALK
ncbi:carbohydrate ABC transporter permease [Paenibacillus piri]|uniref:Carbohydrate ABC transporter permease n=1 Tax=Paenibacillus piri TaxID=2547395 RepID=A0A4R5KJS2_9BACL|nr:carbohydrate ABC transporter permease [Paenibacillus piri]TDF95771.1 carbohydrate ABC transporter permease [Paenibacillus piri]